MAKASRELQLARILGGVRRACRLTRHHSGAEEERGKEQARIFEIDQFVAKELHGPACAVEFGKAKAILECRRVAEINCTVAVRVGPLQRVADDVCSLAVADNEAGGFVLREGTVEDDFE